MKKRIDWIDVAKGVAIILVIIGHSIEYNSEIYRFILSFHMPLFIILSGITYKIPKSKDKIKQNVKKYIKRLLIPYIFTLFVTLLLHEILNNDGRNFLQFMIFFLKTLFGGFGVSYIFLGHSFRSVGPIWFLITLFISKIIFDLINYYFRNKKLDFNIIIYCFLALSSIVISGVSWIPLNFDLVLIFLFYLYVGFLIKKYSNILNKYKNIIFIVSFAIWGICLGFNINIELVYRLYPFGLLSVIESICASYCIIELCKIISTNVIFNKILISIGKISLIILCFNSIDMEGIDIWHLNINCYFFAIIRVLATLLISFTFVFVIDTIKKLKIFSNNGS